MTRRKTMSLLTATFLTGTILFAAASERPQTRTEQKATTTTEVKENVAPVDSTESAVVNSTDTVAAENSETVATAKPTKPAVRPGIYQSGRATHYADSWNGRKTASGERLNVRDYQCAHRTLPFGTLIKVTNKRTGKSAVVRVIDRGPFAKGNVIDLTRAAAEKIGMWGHGVAQVTLEIVEPGTVIKNGEIVNQTEVIEEINEQEAE